MSRSKLLRRSTVSHKQLDKWLVLRKQSQQTDFRVYENTLSAAGMVSCSLQQKHMETNLMESPLMSYMALNLTNNFDPNNQRRFATQVEAGAVASSTIQSYPLSTVIVCEVLKEYTGQVVVNINDPAVVEAVDPGAGGDPGDEGGDPGAV